MMLTPWKLLIFFCILSICYGKKLKVLNGEYAVSGEFPFQVSLQYKSNSRHYCGGSIINENYVITAAHCVKSKRFDIKPQNIQISVGLLTNKPDKIYNVTSIIRHEYYDAKDAYVNDIALLKVSPAFVFNDKIKPVVLPESSMIIPSSTKAMISGWGSTTSPTITLSDRLKKLEVTVISEDECRKILYRTWNNIYNGHLCTLDTSGNRRGPCDHDSGGPLTINGNVLIGIISWGRKDPACGSLEYPNVYTRVSEYIYWIRDNTQ